VADIRSGAIPLDPERYSHLAAVDRNRREALERVAEWDEAERTKAVERFAAERRLHPQLLCIECKGGIELDPQEVGRPGSGRSCWHCEVPDVRRCSACRARRAAILARTKIGEWPECSCSRCRLASVRLQVCPAKGCLFWDTRDPTDACSTCQADLVWLIDGRHWCPRRCAYPKRRRDGTLVDDRRARVRAIRIGDSLPRRAVRQETPARRLRVELACSPDRAGHRSCGLIATILPARVGVAELPDHVCEATQRASCEAWMRDLGQQPDTARVTLTDGRIVENSRNGSWPLLLTDPDDDAPANMRGRLVWVVLRQWVEAEPSESLAKVLRALTPEWRAAVERTSVRGEADRTEAGKLLRRLGLPATPGTVEFLLQEADLLPRSDARLPTEGVLLTSLMANPSPVSTHGYHSVEQSVVGSARWCSPDVWTRLQEVAAMHAAWWAMVSRALPNHSHVDPETGEDRPDSVRGPMDAPGKKNAAQRRGKSAMEDARAQVAAGVDRDAAIETIKAFELERRYDKRIRDWKKKLKSEPQTPKPKDPRTDGTLYRERGEVRKKVVRSLERAARELKVSQKNLGWQTRVEQDGLQFGEIASWVAPEP
jgi:hypothetical protein